MTTIDNPLLETGEVDGGLPWWKAATVAERAQAGDPGAGLDGPGARWSFWTSLGWVQDDPGGVARRAAALGLDVPRFRCLLDEPDGRIVGNGHDAPAWVDQIRECYDPDRGSAAASQAGPDLGIAVRPLVAAAQRRIEDAVAAMGPLDADLAGLADALTATAPRAQLATAAGRTLVLELNVARVEDRLCGDTPEQRYADFCRRLADPRAVLEIWREYPVLARVVATTVQRWEQAVVALARRLVADLPRLRASGLLAGDAGPLRAVRLGAGDVHRHGQSVAVVEFARASVVYKPRSVGPDRAFSALLDWFAGTAPRHALSSPVTLSGTDDGYGWSAFVAHDDCRDEQEVAAFYWRSGALLALMYLFSATDFHFENVIACGAHPMVIDLEAFFHDQASAAVAEDGPGAGWRLDPASERLSRSVLRSGLLPSAMTVRDAAHRNHRVDVSGLGAARHQIAWAQTPSIVDDGTDHMHLVDAQPMIELELANLPTLDGEPVDVAAFAPSLIEGFRHAYRALARDRDGEVLRTALEEFRSLRFRAVLRPTRDYALLLLDSLHPDFLRDARDRQVCLDQLWEGLGALERSPLHGRVVESEIAQLLDGDIPLFEFTPDGRTLLDAHGVELGPVLAASPWETMRARLASLDEADLAAQTALIAGSYATLGMDGAAWTEYATPVTAAVDDPVELRAAASAIADRLLQDVERDGERLGWVNLRLEDDRYWMLGGAGLDLYSGIPGIGLFLAHAGRLLDRDDCASTAGAVGDEAVLRADHLLERLPAADGPGREGLVGGHGPLCGPLLLLAELARTTGSSRWTPAMRRIATAVTDLAPDDGYLDVVGGAAGAVLALLSVRDVMGPEVLEWARAVGAAVLDRAQTRDGRRVWPSRLTDDGGMLNGYSHGASGYAHAFAELYAVDPDQRWAAAARDALSYERQWFDPDRSNWRDLRIAADRADEVGYASSWCHGGPGVALGRLALLELPWRSGQPDVLDRLDLPGGTAGLEADLDAGVRSTVAKLYPGDQLGGMRTHSLCHGDIGTLDVLERAARRRGDTELMHTVGSARNAVLGVAAEHGWSCGVPLGTPTPSLMCGLAGIGLGLLRAAHPGDHADVLLLRVPVTPGAITNAPAAAMPLSRVDGRTEGQRVAASNSARTDASK